MVFETSPEVGMRYMGFLGRNCTAPLTPVSQHVAQAWVMTGTR